MPSSLFLVILHVFLCDLVAQGVSTVARPASQDSRDAIQESILPSWTAWAAQEETAGGRCLGPTEATEDFPDAR